MIAIDNTLISDDIFDKKFVCDLSACKGVCCVEGESGAPLEKDEIEKIRKVFKKVKPYMRPEGIEAVKKQGQYVIDTDGELVTPLVDGAECAYVAFDDNGTAKCTFEQAFLDGKTDWPKPISCHLYPIRVTKLKDFDALNYHRWPICAPACECGDKLDVPIYKFLKAPLIRRYGEAWFKKLEEGYRLWKARG